MAIEQNDEYKNDEEYRQVNHPSHYRHKSGFDAIHWIDMYQMDFATGCIFKYLFRRGLKTGESKEKDEEKAISNTSLTVTKSLPLCTVSPCNKSPMLYRKNCSTHSGLPVRRPTDGMIGRREVATCRMRLVSLRTLIISSFKMNPICGKYHQRLGSL